MSRLDNLPRISAKTIIEDYGVSQTGKHFEYEGKTCTIGMNHFVKSKMVLCEVDINDVYNLKVIGVITTTEEPDA